MATTVISCPQCKSPVRIRDEERDGRCEACNTVVSRAPVTAFNAQAGNPPSQAGPQIVTVLAIVAFLAAGALTYLRKTRHPQVEPTPAVSAAVPIYDVPETAAPEGPARDQIAWNAEARAPVLVAIDTDPVEDIIGFFRMWDGRSAWVSLAGAFDGATMRLLWRTEAIDPQLVKREGIVPTAMVVGPRVVIADTSNVLRVYAIAGGDKQATYSVTDAVVELCRAPDPAAKIWVKVANGQDTSIDLDGGKAVAAARPSYCPARVEVAKGGDAADAGASLKRAYGACHDEFRNRYSHAVCIPGDRTPAPEGLERHYGVADGALSVGVGTRDDRPVVFGIANGKATWQHPLVTDDTKPKPGPPALAELYDGRLFTVYDKVYFDSRFVALDAKTGDALWDVPLVGSLGSTRKPGRGEARAIVASKTRVYVPRAGGSLDVFDLKSGTSLGTIGQK